MCQQTSPINLQFQTRDVSYLYMEPTYKVWSDKGSNVGIQCLVCSKTFWTGFESTIDPTTGAPCTNCDLITSQDILRQENESNGDDASLREPSQPLQTTEVGEIIV